MRRPWSWWVARCARQEDPLPLALVRVIACFVVVADLLRAAQLGLVTVLWRTYESGGLSRFSGKRALIDDLAPQWGGPGAWLVAVASLTLAGLGVGVRPALAVGLLAYAQLGHLYPPGDRAIDRLLRTVFLVLIFSGSHERLSLWRWLRGREPAAQIGAWTSDLLRFILVLVYMGAGFFKLGADIDWLRWTKHPPLYRILADPLAGKLDPTAWEPWAWLFYAGGVATILMECSAFLILTRWARWWGVAGVGMHLGIAAGMHLGMFSWGMLSLYPLIFAPWIVARWGGAATGTARSAPQASPAR